MLRRSMVWCIVAGLIALGCDVFQQAQSVASNLLATPTVAVPATLVNPTSLLAPTSPSGTGIRVQIVSPAQGAHLSAGQVIEVQIAATGGPFVEIVLYADAAFVDRIEPDKNPQFNSALAWKGATPGAHRLRVMAMDANKNVAEVSVDIQVDSGSASTQPIAPSPVASGNLQIRFVNVADGGNLIAQLNDKGIPFVSVTVQANAQRGFPAVMILDADGLGMGTLANNDKALPFQAEFKWSPWRGNGKYTLVAKTKTSDGTADAAQQIAINVTGIPSTATLPLARIIQLYQQQFGLTLSAPALTHFTNYFDPSDSKWVSIAYIGDKMYEVGLFDSGKYWVTSAVLNKAADVSYCRPAGRIRLLVVFVDYGNTGITKDAALNGLKNAMGTTNARYAKFATDHNLKAPILQIETTGAYMPTPPKSGELVTAAQVKAQTGIDPAQFDLLVQVDLDSKHNYAQRNRSEAGGITFFTGCAGGAQKVTIWTEVTASPSDGWLAGTLLDHEFAHAMGWQHYWAMGDASGSAQIDWSTTNPILPAFLFGWLDVDGDGIPEILDPTPYGIKK